MVCQQSKLNQANMLISDSVTQCLKLLRYIVDWYIHGDVWMDVSIMYCTVQYTVYTPFNISFGGVRTEMKWKMRIWYG